MDKWLAQVYGHNTMQDYLVALGIVIVGFFLLRLFRTLVMRRLHKLAERSQTDVDDFVLTVIRRALLPMAYVLLLYAALRSLEFSEAFIGTMRAILTVAMTFFLIRLITASLEYLLHSYLKRRGGATAHRTEVRGMLLVANIIIWAVGLVFLLDNMGFNVATVITGLGVGGVAVALAAQAVLADFFAYFVIFFDRPFEIGDFLIVDGQLGTVEHVGIKTTRLRSLSGEEMIFSNKFLTDVRVHNYKKMERRRVVFNLNVSYDTPEEQLRAIPAMVESFIRAQEGVEFDRGHFASFRDTGLYFEFVYYVLSSDYTRYMNIQQAINLEIYRAFQRQGIAFSFPTQTLQLRGSEGERSWAAAAPAP